MPPFWSSLVETSRVLGLPASGITFCAQISTLEDGRILRQVNRLNGKRRSGLPTPPPCRPSLLGASERRAAEVDVPDRRQWSVAKFRSRPPASLAGARRGTVAACLGIDARRADWGARVPPPMLIVRRSAWRLDRPLRQPVSYHGDDLAAVLTRCAGGVALIVPRCFQGGPRPWSLRPALRPVDSDEILLNRRRLPSRTVSRSARARRSSRMKVFATPTPSLQALRFPADSFARY